MIALSTLLPAVAGLAAGGSLAATIEWHRLRAQARAIAKLQAEVAELKDACARLEPERDRLRDILAAMQEGILALDAGGRIVLANRAFREMFDIVGEPSGRLPIEAISHPGFEELLARGWGALAAVSGEIELLLPSGTSRRLLVHATGLAGRGLLAVCVDVSELRRLEVVRRDFVANVSHELRTPLATILSATETLDQALGSDPEMAVTLADAITRNAKRMERLVEDLLDLSRIESRQHRLPVALIDLSGEIRRIAAQFEEMAAAKGIAIKAEPSPFLPPALADAGALEQVLSNLLENAVKYSSEGGSIAVRAHPEGRMVQVSISDSGPGIEARHLPRLFERFYRVDSGRSREVGGTGLGLAIVKHLVEAMGGTTSVESTVGKGSTFRFTLPREAFGGVRPALPQAPDTAVGKPPEIDLQESEVGENR